MTTGEIEKRLGPRFTRVAQDGALALAELNLPPHAAVLDVGTGKGTFAIYLASQGFEVLTGEPSTDATQYANQDWAVQAQEAGVLDRIRFEPFDASHMPFAAKRFDAVFFFGVLHHIAESDRPAVLREALRVVKDSGAVVFFEPRQAMLEIVWKTDPHHPPAANPTIYLGDAQVQSHFIEGAWMDLYIFHKTAD